LQTILAGVYSISTSPHSLPSFPGLLKYLKFPLRVLEKLLPLCFSVGCPCRFDNSLLTMSCVSPCPPSSYVLINRTLPPSPPRPVMIASTPSFFFPLSKDREMYCSPQSHSAFFLPAVIKHSYRSYRALTFCAFSVLCCPTCDSFQRALRVSSSPGYLPWRFPADEKASAIILSLAYSPPS